MCSALHYKSFLMHGIQTLLKPLRWSSLLFPLPPSYFHHSISTMLFQKSLRLRKDKRSTKKSIFSRQNIFIVTFWKCFEWVQPGNHFKGILFLLQNSFRMNWFLLRLVVSVLGCCNWYGTLCMTALLDFFLQFVQLQLPYMGNLDVLYRLESFDILLFHVFSRVHQKLLNLQKKLEHIQYRHIYIFRHIRCFKGDIL